MSTTEPGTMPPPSTRSSSGIPEGILISENSSTAPIATGEPLPLTPAARDEREGRAMSSSVSVFHSPQFGHLPTHLGDVEPQD